MRALLIAVICVADVRHRLGFCESEYRGFVGNSDSIDHPALAAFLRDCGYDLRRERPD